MLNKILNIGVSGFNAEALNRKIRTSNLIAFITIVIMFSFIPVSLYFHTLMDLILTVFFIATSVTNYILHSAKKHTFAFSLSIASGFIYFICATMVYGLVSNLHFYLLIMCMIVVMMLDNKYVIKGYIVFSVIAFFGLLWYMNGKEGLVHFPPEMKQIQIVIGYIVLLLLFVITAVFFIFFKNENLTYQKAVMHQKEIIEEKNKDITASITYAKRLQEAILPSKALIDKAFPEAFIFYRPKDIVAGDFYWMEKIDPENKNRDTKLKNTDPEITLFAAADCTGHGVPGAMVSVVCSNALNRAVKEFGISDPGKILDKVRELVVETFEKSENDVKDGMDISLFSIDDSRTELKWAGANNPLLLMRNDTIIEYKPNKQPIGKVDIVQPFTTHTITLEKGDTIYIFTDGFADQFGGPKGKKFKYSQLKDLLTDIYQLPMKQQSEKIEHELIKWKDNLEQVDDILVIGIRV